MTMEKVLIKCDCHGTQTMCALEGDRIVIERRVGHLTHRFTIVLDESVRFTTRLIPQECGKS